jgi:hypothetical protein
MEKESKWPDWLQLNFITITIIVAVALAAIVVIGEFLDTVATANSFKLDKVADSTNKADYEIFKLRAEVQQIRSDTAGRAFWIKLVGIFITVIGAIAGFLVGQSKAAKDRLKAEEKRNQDQLAFEHRKDVDEAYQQIVQELSADKAVLRAAAAVKLGAILQNIPAEWNISDERKQQLIKLTKQVIAAALAIEEDEKVRKTLSIALVLHKPASIPPAESKELLSDVKGMDLSHANAADAYWARADFSGTDFYRADLQKTSFRRSKLTYAQFRETNLRQTVFKDAECRSANFLLADLREADFTGADLTGASFAKARVFGVIVKDAKWSSQPGVFVDTSASDGEKVLEPFDEWMGVRIGSGFDEAKS